MTKYGHLVHLHSFDFTLMPVDKATEELIKEHNIKLNYVNFI